MVCIYLWLQQKYDAEAEKRDLSRLLEKKTHEAENLIGDLSLFSKKLFLNPSSMGNLSYFTF